MYTQDTPLAIQRPASEAQINRLIRALTERVEDPQEALSHIKWVNEHRLSSSLVSAKITEYEAKPKVRSAFSHTAGDVEIGMYLVDGVYYKVQRAVHGSGHLYAKRWDEDAETFTMESGAIRRIRASHALTREEAERFGQITGQCGRCGRTLNNEESIARGLGPECATKV